MKHANYCYLFHSWCHCIYCLPIYFLNIIYLNVCVDFLSLHLLFVQESMAFMFEVTNLHEDSLREYDELELCYSESGFSQTFFWHLCCIDF
jgi:hypothetical protein